MLSPYVLEVVCVPPWCDSSQVLEATGFAQGLFTEEELDSNNLKEKGPKVQYLEKIVNLVGIQTGVHCPVRLRCRGGCVVEKAFTCAAAPRVEQAKPGKIVAGVDPEDTNKFLQLLGIACQRCDGLFTMTLGPHPWRFGLWVSQG